MKKVVNLFSNLGFVLQYVFRLKKSYIFVSLIMSLLSIIGPITEIWGPKNIVNMLTENQSLKKILILVGFVTLLELLKALIFSIYNSFYLPTARCDLKSAINQKLFKKVSVLEMECFESVDFFDDYTRAIGEADNRFVSIVDSLSMLLGNIIYLITLGGLIIEFDIFLLIVIAACVTSTMVIQAIRANISYQFNNEHTSTRRKMQYIRMLFYEPKYAKEIRVFDIKDIALNKYKTFVKTEKELYAKQGKRYFLLDILLNSIRIGLLITFVMVYLVYRVRKGVLSVGDFLAVYLAVMQATNQLLDFIGSFSKMYEHSLFIQNFLTIINYSSNKRQSVAENFQESHCEQEEICFKEVSFRYYNTDKYVVNNLSFQIKKGEKVAIVGQNGAGKSTIVKLLLGLYSPAQGNIYVNKQNVDNYDKTELYDKIGVVFQDFEIYALSIAENILLSSIEDERDELRVWEALKKVGLYDKVQNLKSGIYTPISKEFDENGTLFSGGELQKIAIARVFVQDYDIIILDEPSSALDPIAENDFFQFILEATQGKTVIFITHRLSTIYLSEKIFYVEEGQIIESGSFQELMAIDGKFSSLYRLQANKYKTDLSIEPNCNAQRSQKFYDMR